MKAILVILATLGSVDLDKLEWRKIPRIMRQDIKRYHKLERKEIRKNEREEQNDRLYDEQGVSRPSKSISIA
jgi:hypothetical protein